MLASAPPRPGRRIVTPIVEALEDVAGKADTAHRRRRRRGEIVPGRTADRIRQEQGQNQFHDRSLKLVGRPARQDLVSRDGAL